MSVPPTECSICHTKYFFPFGFFAPGIALDITKKPRLEKIRETFKCPRCLNNFAKDHPIQPSQTMTTALDICSEESHLWSYLLRVWQMETR
jgi:hypothetical protein